MIAGAGQRSLPEEHEDGGGHQEDLVTGDELQDILLVGRQLVQEVPYEAEAGGAHGLQGPGHTQ